MKRGHSHVHQRNRGIKSFADMTLPASTTVIEVENNKITDFCGLPDLKKLRLLNLEGNPIRSFKGSGPIGSLKWVSLRFTPLSICQHLKVMCLIVFGNQIATINNEPVTNQMRATAGALRKRCLEKLQSGMILHSLNPLKFVVPKVRVVSLRRNPSSVATVCEKIISGNKTLSKRAIRKFMDKLGMMRERFAVSDTKIVEFHQRDQQEFDSDATFHGYELKRVVLPKNLVVDDDTYYSDDEEEDRTDSRGISTSSISSYSGRVSETSEYESDSDSGDRQSYLTTTSD